MSQSPKSAERMSRGRLAVAVGLLALLWVLAPGCALFDVGTGRDREDEIDTYLNWSNYFYYQGQQNKEGYERSKRLALMALEKNPDDIMAQVILGYCLLKLGPWDSTNPGMTTARSVFTKLLEKEPDNYRARLGLGICEYKLSRTNSRGLSVFERALTALDDLYELAGKLQDAGPNRAVGLDHQLESQWEGFARDIRKTHGRKLFPTDPYASLVSLREAAPAPAAAPGSAPAPAAAPGSTPAGSSPAGAPTPVEGPAPADIDEALAARLEALLKAADGAVKAPALDLRVFSANLNRLEVLLTVGRDYYRTRYDGDLARAMTEFSRCEAMHEKKGRTYHWVFEYIGHIWALRATILPAGSDARRAALGKMVLYYEKFLEGDVEFEERRLSRMDQEQIKDLEDNPYWTRPIKEYKTVMLGLVVQARQNRLKVLQSVINTLSTQLQEYSRALVWVEAYKRAEELFGETARRPYRHFFFRAEVYREHALAKLEWLYGKRRRPRDPRDPNELGASEVPASERGAVDRLKDLPTGAARSKLGAEVGRQKDAVVDLARDAFREYQRFLKPSSLVNDRVFREQARDAIQWCVKQDASLAALPDPTAPAFGSDAGSDAGNDADSGSDE